MPSTNTPTTTSTIGPELQAIPLQMLISGAMNGIVSAQAISAQTTVDFLKNTSGQMQFNASVGGANNQVSNVQISVPELAVVPVPSLRVDSATIHFNFEIKEFSSTSVSNDASGNLNAGTEGALKSIISATLSGSITHKSAADNTVNRSGMLDVTIHLSEPPIPEGLSKVLSMLSNAITVTGASSTQSATVQNQTVQNATVQGQTVQNATVQSQTVQSSSVQSSTVQGQTVQSSTVQDATVQSQTVQSSGVQSPPVPDATVQGQTVQSSTVQDATVQDQTVQSPPQPVDPASPPAI